MGFQIDYFNKLVLVTSPTTTADSQVMHDFIEDQMATPLGLVSDGDNPSFFGDIIKPEGKIEDPTNPGVFSQIILILNSEWQIQFFAGSGYTKIVGAKIVGGVGDEPFKATGTAGDITVLESPVDGLVVETGGGVLTTDQKAELTRIDLATIYQNKVINNLKEILKIASSWYLIIYETGEASGGTELLRKHLTDLDGNEIDDLTAGILAAELENTV